MGSKARFPVPASALYQAIGYFYGSSGGDGAHGGADMRVLAQPLIAGNSPVYYAVL
jgi:hypothetical protein